jgi:predicted nucleotidyltransferase
MAKSRLRDLDARLEQFAAQLEAAAGDNLVSLVLYGSAAVGAAREDSDVNLLLVLHDAGSTALGTLSPAMRDWVRAGERPPLIFSEESWRAAADVFPLEIEDIRATHRVLRGADPVAGIATTWQDQRHELEREVRSLLIRLRAAYPAAGTDGKALADVLAESFRSLLPLFRAALRLSGAPASVDRQDLVRQIGDLANLDATAFEWPQQQLAGAKPPGLAAHDSRAARYLDAVDAFVDYVDRALLQETP